MEFKVGDKVRLKEKYKNVLFNSRMVGQYIEDLVNRYDYFTIDRIDNTKVKLKESTSVWMLDWFEKIEESQPIHDEIHLSYMGDTTIAIHEKVGISVRGKDDKEDRKIGILIAVMRAVGFKKKTVDKVIDALFDDVKELKDYTDKELLEEISRRMK